MKKGYYNVNEFAEAVGVTRQTVNKWDRTGKFKARRTAVGMPYYKEEDVNRYFGEDVEEPKNR